MKKTITILSLAFAFAIVSCGPNAEDAKREKEKQDSIKRADSLAGIQGAMDMVNSAPADTAKADSAAAK